MKEWAGLHTMKDLQDILVEAYKDKLIELEGLNLLSQYTSIPLPNLAVDLSHIMLQNITMVQFISDFPPTLNYQI